MADELRWGWPLNARKAHVFRGGISLCGSWMFFGADGDPITSMPERGPDDCANCHRKLGRRFGAQTVSSAG